MNNNLTPCTDHESLIYIADKLDNIEADINDLKSATDDVASRSYVDKQVGRVNDRLDDYMSGGSPKTDKRSDSNVWNFLMSRAGQSVAMWVCAALLALTSTVGVVHNNQNSAQTDQLIETIEKQIEEMHK